jgi:hypothetical protein
VSLSVRLFDEAQLPPDFQIAREFFSDSQAVPISVRPLSGESVAGYAQVNDVFDAPALLVRVDEPRAIYAQGRVSLGYFLAALLVREILLAPGIESYLVFDPSGLARLDAPFIDWGRRPALGDLAALARSFLADNLLAPGPRILMLDTTRGPQQLIQLVERGRILYALGAGALAVLAVGLAVTCRSFAAVLRSPGSLLAFACIGFNLALHYFYRGHGQQFLYAVHAAFPLVLLLAQLYAASGWRWRRAVLGLALVAVFASNLEAARGVRALLDRECAHETTRPREPCREWR